MEEKIEVMKPMKPVTVEVGREFLTNGREVTIRSKGPMEIKIDLDQAIRELWRGVGCADIDTLSGGRIDFLALSPDDINFDDIAIGLSNTCRFAGQISEFYSVAEHSVLVSKVLEVRLNGELPGIVESAFMHDAPEAYIGDMVSPLKKLCPGFQMIEESLELAIRQRFGLAMPFGHPMIKAVDLGVYYAERNIFRDSSKYEEGRIPEGVSDLLPAGLCIRNLSPKDALKEFYERAEELGIVSVLDSGVIAD